MVKRKVSLSADGPSREAARGEARPVLDEALELFFNTGIVFHEVPCPRTCPTWSRASC